MRDFSTILQSAVTKDYGVWKPCPSEWKVKCNLCRRHLKAPQWCEIIMGRAIKGICPQHGEVNYSVE